MRKFLKLKMEDVSNNTKFLSIVLSLICISAIGIFGYYEKYLSNTTDPDFTISDALAYANKIPFIILMGLLFILLFNLHLLRNNFYINFWGNLFAIIFIGIVISLVYITPLNNPNLHNDLAIGAFVSVFLYNILILYLLTHNYKYSFIHTFLLLLNISCAISLGVITFTPEIKKHIVEHDLNNIGKYEYVFAITELVSFSLFISSILLLGFNGKGF
jgi:hypothetical protein